VTETKLLDEGSVGLEVTSLEIREQSAASPDHLEEATAAVVVLEMGAEMVGEGIDPLGQEGHLHLGRPGISGVGLVLGRDRLLVEAHAVRVLWSVSRRNLL
jgi:hypothetical protein